MSRKYDGFEYPCEIKNINVLRHGVFSFHKEPSNQRQGPTLHWLVRIYVFQSLMEFWQHSHRIILHNLSRIYGSVTENLDRDISCDKCSTSVRVKKLQALELRQTSVHVTRTHAFPAPILLRNPNLSEHLLLSTGVSSSLPLCSCFSSKSLSSAPHCPPSEIPSTFSSEPARFSQMGTIADKSSDDT